MSTTKLLFCSSVLLLAAWFHVTTLADNSDVDELLKLRFATYNVRFDSTPDNISVRQTIESLPKDVPSPPPRFYQSPIEHAWSSRRINVANDILWSRAQIYGGQELLIRQVNDVQELLGSAWSWIGIGRNPGHSWGNEYNPIFYRNDQLLVQDWDTFWLSTTPFEPSKYEGAGSFRICTTAHMTGNGASFTHLNTHLDHISPDQRALGASMILHRAKYEAITTRRPVFLTGDFNSPQDDIAYRVMTGAAPMVEMNQTFLDRFSWTSEQEVGFEKFTMLDLLGETPPQRRSGNYATFTHFAPVYVDHWFRRLDYIFAGSTNGWNVTGYHVGTNLYDNGEYASDHRPVFADIEIATPPSIFRPAYLVESMMQFFFRAFG